MSVEFRQFVRNRAPRVWWSFIIIVLGFILVNVVSIYEMQNSQANVRLITKHAAMDIELVARLSRDIEREQVLLEDHILERNPHDMERTEMELADIDAEIKAAERSYQPIGDDAEERFAWQVLDEEIKAIEPEVESIVSLSRKNADAEAQAVNRTLAEQFERIDQATTRLLTLNHNRTNQEAAEVRSLQRRAGLILAVLTLIWSVFAILTAIWVIRLLTDRERQMRKTMALLEGRNRELDAFAARVAHDLRGPLTAINLAAAQMRQRRTYDDGTGGVLQRAVKRMEAMIQDLLTLSRVGAQAMGATAQMADVAAGAQEDLMPKIEAAGGELRIDAADAVVSGHPGLLRQVLWNLGENAVKYRRSEVQLQVEIRGRVTPSHYELVVSDNGPGMPTTVVRQAFEPFFRGKDAASTPGTGLGLSVVKRVVESSGGTIWIDSEVGRGTTFRIHLPLAAKAA